LKINVNIMPTEESYPAYF